MAAKLFMSFGTANNAQISRLSADFAFRLQIFLLVVKLKYGYDVLVVNGLRSDAQQAALHAADSRNPATPGDHGDGNAADLNFLRNGKLVLVKASSDAAWQPIYRLAAQLGIANGSRFSGYRDSNHFFIRTSSNPQYAYYLSVLKLFQV